MRKIFNIIISFVVAFTIFSFVNVKAASGEIGSVKVTYKDNELEKLDGVYQVEAEDYSTNQLMINITFNGVSGDGSYRFAIIKEGAEADANYANGLYNPNMMQSLSLNTDSKSNNLEIVLFKSNGDGTFGVIDREPLKLYADFNTFDEAKIVFEEVSQNGQALEIREENGVYYYDLNPHKDVVTKFKGSEFVDELVYTIRMNRIYYYFTGKELNEGVSIVSQSKRPLDYQYQLEMPEYISCNLYGYNAKNYILNHDDKEVKFTYYIGDNPEYFDYQLKYANYLNDEIMMGMVWGKYAVYGTKHNSNNPLAVLIDGENYTEDKSYHYSVQVINSKNNVVYTKDGNLSGKDINDGKLVELTGYILRGRKDASDDSSVNVDVTIDGSTTRYVIDYESGVTLEASLFYENGRKSVVDAGSWADTNMLGSMFITNKSLYNRSNHIYLHYVGSNFDNSKTYSYEIYKTYVIDPRDGVEGERTIIRSGNISGLQLNTIGSMVELETMEGTDNPLYYFIVRDGEYIVYTNKSSIELYDMPTPTTAKLSYGDKDMHIQLSNYNYVATRNNDVSVRLSGVEYEDDTNYKIVYAEELSNESMAKEYGPRKSIIVKGKDLNDGVAYVDFSTDEDLSKYSYRHIWMAVAGEDEEVMSGPEGKSYFTIKYVNCINLFDAKIPYVIDDFRDLISHISKNTSVEDFSENAEVKDNGKVEVYDKNGKKVKDKVGTGMKARVIDGEGNDVIDVDISVTGDTTGDGDITITDLVQTEQHVAGVNELDGVYETAAGDVDGEDGVGITDVVQICQDVSGVEGGK